MKRILAAVPLLLALTAAAHAQGHYRTAPMPPPAPGYVTCSARSVQAVERLARTAADLQAAMGRMRGGEATGSRFRQRDVAEARAAYRALRYGVRRQDDVCIR
jgi:hypothetical protein